MAKKILFVDDDEEIRKIVKELLGKSGYDVDTLNDGLQCLDYLKNNKPDLILLDMMLPLMSGKQLLTKIKENDITKDIPVLFLTAVDLSEAGEKILRECGAVDFIAKPFESEQFVAKIKEVLRE